MAWKLLFPLFIVAILVTFHQVDGTLRDILSQSRSKFDRLRVSQFVRETLSKKYNKNVWIKLNNWFGVTTF